MLSKRRAAYRESLREDILDAARPFFARDGYEATSIRKIADKLGCSPGILYHYFKDKDEIMAALVQEGFQKLLLKLRPIAADSSTMADRMRRALRAYIEFGLENPSHYSVLFGKTVDFVPSDATKKVFHTHGMEVFGCLRRMSQEALASGKLRKELTDAEEVAQVLWMGIHGAVSVRIGAKGFPFLEQERLTDRIIDVLLAGVLKQK
jgi:AcrR family transcriptional regulator